MSCNTSPGTEEQSANRHLCFRASKDKVQDEELG